jgi:hypothetical protein
MTIAYDIIRGAEASWRRQIASKGKFKLRVNTNRAQGKNYIEYLY